MCITSGCTRHRRVALAPLPGAGEPDRFGGLKRETQFQGKWSEEVVVSPLEALGGTRHQSAARFVATNHDAVALVISQDGHPSAAICIWLVGVGIGVYPGAWVAAVTRIAAH